MTRPRSRGRRRLRPNVDPWPPEPAHNVAMRRVGAPIVFPRLAYRSCTAVDDSGYGCCLVAGHDGYHEAWSAPPDQDIYPGGPGHVVAVWTMLR